MSACEKCWEQAQRDVMLLGGSVVDHYRRRFREHGQRLLDAAKASGKS